jgi:hypothetical protein
VGLVALALVGTHSPARGQKPEVEVVVIVPGPSADKDSVLVTPRLLAQLRALARPTPAPNQGAVLVSALYEGKLAGEQAEFTATLYAHVLGDEPARLEVPLDGAQLTGDVLLDGARAFPVALPAPRKGFGLKLKGKGRHKVEMRFQSAVRAGGGDGPANPGVRQVGFTAPRLVQGRLVFRPGAGASHLQVPVKHGAQVVADEPGGLKRLEADLGAVAAPVQVRWYQAVKGGPRPARLEVREAYLWDLAADASTLTAYLRYRISGGAESRLQVGLPAELDVLLATAGRPEGGGPADPSVRLADWTVATGPKGRRLLQLDMAGPVAGEVEVTLWLVPRGPWPSPALLPLPRPLGKPVGQWSYLAYREKGVQARQTQLSGLRGSDPNQFAPFWPATSRPSLPPLKKGDPSIAFQFRPGDQPKLGIAPRVERPKVATEQDVSLLVGPRQADFSARLLVTPPKEGKLLLAEWDVLSSQRLVLTEVSGPNVRGWTQNGSRLVVWLEAATRQTAIRLEGWVSLDLRLVGGKRPPAPARLELPCLRPVHEGSVRTQLRLACEAGLRVEPLDPVKKSIKNLIPQGPASARPVVYTSQSREYRGLFSVVQGQGPRARVVTEVSRRGRELLFTSTIDYREGGEPRPVELRLRNWAGEARLEAVKGETRRRESYRRQGGRRQRAWTLEMAAGKTVRLVLRGTLALDEARDGALAPEVTVAGAHVEQKLIADSSLAADGSSGLRSVPGPAGQQAWETRGTEWSLRLLPRDPGALTVRLLLAEHRARLADGPRWLHEVSWWLWQDGPSALWLNWPEVVDLLSVTVDERPLAPSRSEPERLWLPLSGPAGPRYVVVRYRYKQGRERAGQPNLALPQLEKVAPGPTLWTVAVPPGWQLPSGSPRALRGPTRCATLELYRARAQLSLSKLLFEHGQGDDPALARSGERLEQSLWLARLALEAGADGKGPDGEGLLASRSRLSAQGERLWHDHQLEKPARAARAADRWTRGAEVSWAAESGTRAPAPVLALAGKRQVQAALSFSGPWLVGLLVVWTVALSSVLRTLVRWLWPEAVLLAGLLGWQAVGLTGTVLLLVLLGVGGRLLVLGRGLRALLARHTRQASSSVRG